MSKKNKRHTLREAHIYSPYYNDLKSKEIVSTIATSTKVGTPNTKKEEK